MCVATCLNNTVLSDHLQAPAAEMLQATTSGTGPASGQDKRASDSWNGRPLNIRPSMEARRRRLGLSALQVSFFILLFTDINIIITCHRGSFVLVRLCACVSVVCVSVCQRVCINNGRIGSSTLPHYVKDQNCIIPPCITGWLRSHCPDHAWAGQLG